MKKNLLTVAFLAVSYIANAQRVPKTQPAEPVQVNVMGGYLGTVQVTTGPGVFYTTIKCGMDNEKICYSYTVGGRMLTVYPFGDEGAAIDFQIKSIIEEKTSSNGEKSVKIEIE
ncbi:MAG: hypothetical protein OHK0045_10340 [Raineya sp.]